MWILSFSVMISDLLFLLNLFFDFSFPLALFIFWIEDSFNYVWGKQTVLNVPIANHYDCVDGMSFIDPCAFVEFIG